MIILWFASSVCLASASLGILKDLPSEHIPYFFTNNPEVAEKCSNDDTCLYKDVVPNEKCWGYEDNCPKSKRMLEPSCQGDSRRWARSKEEQMHTFWKSADFGYVKERESELTTYCKPYNTSEAMLECSSFTRFCRGKNIFFDFTTAKLMEGNNRYREDVFGEQQLGAHCRFSKEAFHEQGEHKSALQSWFGELQHFRGLKSDPFADDRCDVIIDRPTFFMKLDAGVNMYHHFCDFINLYMTQHLNNSFSRDVTIVMWDTSPMRYGDFFGDTFQAFSQHPVIHLNTFDGKRLCVRDAVFSLLPRMRYGHFYNMPLIPGCEKTALYRAFSQQLVHRLGLTQEGPLKDKVRITLLSRNSKFRNILNQHELVRALEQNPEYEVKVVEYNTRTMPYLSQLQHTHNSDIFIGMHGAGLTHMLLQPDWGVIFEIANCEDEHCYKDLARLRGVHYMTWEREDKVEPEDEGHHPTLGAHKKFTNYSFDVHEFLRLVKKAAQHVKTHPAFRTASQTKYGPQHTEL